MSVRAVHRQVTEHGTEIQLHEDEDSPHAYVEVCLYEADTDAPLDGPAYLSLTPKEAVAFADAVLSSAQRVSDRQPHGNS